MHQSFLYLILSTLILQNPIKGQTVITGVWYDDFAQNATGIDGWYIYEWVDADTFTSLGNPYIVGNGGKKYHGPLSGNTYNIFERKFQCAADAKIWISYKFAFCLTENSDFLNLYVLDDNRQWTLKRQDSMQLGGRGNSNLGTYENPQTIWGNNLPGDVLAACDWTDEYEYKEVTNEYMGRRTSTTTFSVELDSKTSGSNEYAFLWDFQLHCDFTPAPTQNPTSHPSNAPSITPSKPTTATPTTFIPSTSPIIVGSPTASPIITATPHPTDSVSPTKGPTINPTKTPTPSPTTNPSLHPTNHPTNSPTTNSPTTKSPTTNSPTTKSPTTKSPTTKSPTTEQPSVEPTDNPSYYSNITTPQPTNNPIIAGPPTPSPTLNPSNNPTSIPSTMSPTNSPTTIRRAFRFRCFYNDRKINYYSIYMTLPQYADLMINATLSSIESITFSSTNYEETQMNQRAAWKRGGISHFEICSIFTSVDLKQNCSAYQEESDSDEKDVNADFSAVGTFDMIVERELDEYQEYLIGVMLSNKFKKEVTDQMNQALDNMIDKRQRRRNLLTDNFEAVLIQVMAPQNITPQTTETPHFRDKQITQNGNNAVVASIIILFILIVLFIIGIVAVVYYRKAKVNHNAVENVKNENKENVMDNDIVNAINALIDENDFEANIMGNVRKQTKNNDCNAYGEHNDIVLPSNTNTAGMNLGENRSDNNVYDDVILDNIENRLENDSLLDMHAVEYVTNDRIDEIAVPCDQIYTFRFGDTVSM